MNAVAARVTGGKKPENGPRRLRRGAGTNSARGRIMIRPDAFAPTTVRILDHPQPLGGLLDMWLVVVDADRFQASQHEVRTVNVVTTPASKPAAVRLLFF